MASILLDQLCFNYDSPYNDVFNYLSLVMDTTWRTGLIGRNGKGKSTLLKLIAGELAPTSGQVDIHAPTCRFPSSAHGEYSTLEVIMDAIAPFRHWTRRMDELLEAGDDESVEEWGRLQEKYQAAGGYTVTADIEREFDQMKLASGLLQRQFSTLSGGEQTRALIVSLFVNTDRFPLIDEPTNHLDARGRMHLGEYLAGKSGFLLVSHDRYFLDSCTDHIVSMNRSDIHTHHGNYSRWKSAMEEQMLHEERTRNRIEREVKHLKQAAAQRRQGSRARENDKYARGRPATGDDAIADRGFIGHSAAKQMKRALAIEKRIDDEMAEKQRLLKNREKARDLKIWTDESHTQALLSIHNLSVSFGDRKVLDNFSLSLQPGDRIAVTGEYKKNKSHVNLRTASSLAGNHRPANAKNYGNPEIIPNHHDID